MTLLLVTLLLLVGCGEKQGEHSTQENLQNPIQTESSAPNSENSSYEDPESPPLKLESISEDRIINQAIGRIPGFENMDDTTVLAVKNYFYEMGWMEANQITTLERYYPLSDDAYFLIIPRFVHSDIIVETIEFRDGEFKPVAVTYEKRDTPNDFALVLNTIQPEGGPTLRVTVTYDGQRGSYNFTYSNYSDEDQYKIKDGVYLVEASKHTSV